MCIIVDDQWGEAMNTPKTRGLKQYITSLKMYNNNTFIDGKKLEMSHIIPKWFLKKFSNHKGPLKYWQSKKCFQMLSMIYVLNGGKWGKNWKFSAGSRLLNLKHPCKPNKPHPFLEGWLIPQPKLFENKIVISQVFASHVMKAAYWRRLFNNYSDNEFITRIKHYFKINDLTFADIKNSSQWQLHKIKSFHFNDSFKSFQTSFVSQKQRILVKIDNEFIMESSELIKITYKEESVGMMYGQYWPIHKNRDEEKWCNDQYTSMDFIYTTEANFGWNFLINITEPVFVIHDCLLLSDAIKKKIPQEFRPCNAYDWIQNILYYSNRIHEWIKENRHTKLKYPCGPKYTCKKHQVTSCDECTVVKGEYPQQAWNIEWCCNEIVNPKKWIFDSKNGLAMTTMKTTTR